MMRRPALAVLFLLAFGVRQAAAQGCSLTDTSMNFGTYTGTLLNGSSTGRVKCPGSWNIPLNAGTGAGATVSLRKLTGPGGTELNYRVFQDAARTINWGDTTGSELTGSGNTDITFYGQILAGQYVIPGTYTDTLSTSTTHFSVSVTVVNACIISATNLAFGNYSFTLINSTATISVTCTNTTSYNVGLNAGTATGATVTNRSMTGPASALLGYKLFSDSAHTINWGNTIGVDTVAGRGAGAMQSLTVYGQLPAGQYVRPGNYADTITATITY